MKVVVDYIGGVSKSEILLPASKSISNRALVIQKLGNLSCNIENLSTARDTQMLQSLLSSQDTELYAGEGGTTFRFLIAYCAISERKSKIIAGPSLSKRPVSGLIDALKVLGAHIDVEMIDDHLCVSLNGGKLVSTKLVMDGTVSSQFISALMMIAPLLDGGLEIELTGEVLSIPYIEMTASVMSHYGINADFRGNLISIPHGNYHSKDLVVEPDWSAASYWYEILALSDMKQILLKGLTAKSLQGDKCIDNLMTQFGITTTYTSEGALLEKQTGFDMPDYFIYDFSSCPDLAPAVAVLCGGLNITADLPGLKNFRLKESDRASALQRELYNFNIKTDFCGGSKFKLYAGRGPSGTRHEVKTYNDHRIAMAMAPLCCLAGSFLIDNPLVTEKSYPDYFHDLEKAGFKISVIT